MLQFFEDFKTFLRLLAKAIKYAVFNHKIIFKTMKGVICMTQKKVFFIYHLGALKDKSYDTEEEAIEKASRYANDNGEDYGIFELTKMVKPERKPVVIEDVD